MTGIDALGLAPDEERGAAERSAWRAYQEAREWLASLGEPEPERLGSGAYLLQASPIVARRLRHHTHHLGGSRPADCEHDDPLARPRFCERLAALVEMGGEELLVPEPAVLGGYGFEVAGARYNADTLVFCEALATLRSAGALPDPRPPEGRRPVVWEIGAGWGGFAAQVRRLFPEVTYVLTDHPERLLLAATYLGGTFPDARTWYWRPEGERADADALAEVDFAFLPDAAVETFDPEPLELTLTLEPFSGRGGGEADQLARWAWERGSRFLYYASQRGAGAATESGLTARRAAMERLFWLHETPILPPPRAAPRGGSGGGKQTVGPVGVGRPKQTVGPADVGRRLPFALEHLLGWRRLRS